MSKKKHYTLQEDLTYDADITMIISKRNIGKTFGIREQVLNDFRNHEERFSTIVRHKDYISNISKNYFSGVCQYTKDEKLKEWLNDLNTPLFRLSNSAYEMAPRLKNGKPSNKWQTIGYFTGLAIKQDAKERTYENVRRIIYDEAIIEPEDLRYRSYLPNEWGNLASLISSMSKARTSEHKVSAYFLANAVDLLNPIFQRLNIYEIPEYGRKWYNAGTKEAPVSFLLHMVDPDIYEPYVTKDNDLGARMLKGAEAAAYDNAFNINMDEFIEKKPKNAHYEACFIYRGKTYALWSDYSTGCSYISKRFITGLNKPMFALTTQDNHINYLAAKESKRAMSLIIDYYSRGSLRFESVELREGMFRMFKDFGVR